MTTAQSQSQYANLVLQKLKIEPPTKFNGRGDFDRWFKRLANYLSLSDEHYRLALDEIAKGPNRVIVPTPHYAEMDQAYGLTAGTTAVMSRSLYYILDGLLDDTSPPYALLDSTMEHNGFDVIRKLCERYGKAKQIKSILLLVKIVTTRLDDSNFENAFATWESDVTKFELAIQKELYSEIKVGLLIAGTSGKLHEHLCLNVTDQMTYQDVKGIVLNYTKHRVTLANSSMQLQKGRPSHDHMEVDALAAKQPKKCTYCGMQGHTEENCWKKHPQLRGSSGSWQYPKGGHKGDYRAKGKGKGKNKGNGKGK